MAVPLSTYDLLQAEVGTWLNRADLASEIPTFIRLIEARVNRKSRCWQMVKRAYAPLTPGEYTPLPGDYLELKRARIVALPGGGTLQQPQKPLEYASMGEIDRIQAESVINQMPRWYCIVGNAIRLGPVPDQQYVMEIIYYAKLPPLAENAQTNWLLADHPDIYLHGALASASRFLKADPRVALWKSATDEALEELTDSNDGGEHGGQPRRATFKPYGPSRRSF